MWRILKKTGIAPAWVKGPQVYFMRHNPVDGKEGDYLGLKPWQHDQAVLHLSTIALQDDERMVTEAGVGFLDVGCGRSHPIRSLP